MIFIQTERNLVSTSCFKLEFEEDDDITLQNAYPMSDDEGKNLAPYTFTIRNVCSTTAFYQVNLEELETGLKTLSSSYVKVSLNGSKGKILSTYERVEKTLEDTATSHKLISGSLKENETQTFSLRLWLDEATPPLDEVMNATFMSKVVIKAFHKEDIDNTLVIESTSLNEEFSNQEEVISFTGRSEKYNIIEYSLDNVIWNSVDTPAKEVTILQTYKEDGEYTIYFKDEIGNVIEKTVSTLKLDQESPILNASATEYKDGIKIDASKSSDSKSKIKNYYYRLGDGEYILSNTNTYTFAGLSDGIYTITIKIEDNAGNVTDEITKEVTVAYAQVYVSSSGNDETGVGSMENPYATLQPAYNKVKSGGEIILLSDLTAVSTTTMNIKDKHVTLKSYGDAIYTILKDSNFTTQILDIANSNTVTTTNITFDGNEVISSASLIEVHDSVLNLKAGTTVQKNNNRGRYYDDFGGQGSLGGGVFVFQGELNIYNADIIHNKTSEQTDSWASGGGIYMAYGTVNFYSGNISDNENVGVPANQVGGGLGFSNGTFNMFGGTIANNKTHRGGGGVSLEGSVLNTIMTMTGGTIENNVVRGNDLEDGGGGVWAKAHASSISTIVYLKGGNVRGNSSLKGTDTYTVGTAQIINE